MSDPTLTPFCTAVVKLEFIPIGKVSAGNRVDIPFEGTATSAEWDGEIPVAGVDRVTIGADGVMDLDIVARMGSGKEVISYRATGRGTPDGPRELFTFETANEKFAYLNTAIGVAIGSIDGNKLTLEVYLVNA